MDDEWLCQECWGRLEYLVVFDMFGGRIIHETELLIGNESDDERTPVCDLLGPFTKEEAEAFLKEKNDTRDRV